VRGTNKKHVRYDDESTDGGGADYGCVESGV
jgi:hypothetical protein